MSAPNSPFALPDRRAHKAAPQLLRADEAHLAAVADALRSSLETTTDALRAALARPGGGGQAALERDLEVHRLSRSLATLRRHGLDVCLGRMVPADGGAPVYVGRLGLSGPDGDRLLVDWRSPAAEPFFGATIGDTMGLASRRRYRWSGKRITDYWDEVLDPDAAEGAALAPDDQSSFIASLGAARDGRMRDVLGTIQADQDAIVRADSRGALVVDGGPGTGKTVVALHRTASLVYRDPRLSAGHGGVLLVGPGRAYLDYVADVLPSLGEEGVVACTLPDMVPEGRDALPEADLAVAALKGRVMIDAVETAVRQHERPPRRGLRVETEWADLVLDAADWAEAFDAVDAGTPHDEARAEVWEELVRILLDQADDEDLPAGVSRRALRAEIERDEELGGTFRRAWPLLDPAGVVADLYSVPGYLRECAPTLTDAEVALLQREDPRAWTVADLPVLDAARRRIGDPDVARRDRERSVRLAAQRERMERVIDDLIAADDDHEGVVTMLRGSDFAVSLEDESEAPAPEPDALAGPFAHVVVDEAQELTDAEWAMIVRRCPSGSMTIVGDRAQTTRGFPESWAERLDRVGVRDARVSTLTVNYRTPSEVMAVAEPVIRAVLPDANVPTSVRDSGLPVRRLPRSARDGVVGAWTDTNPEGTACVIGDPTFAGTARVRSLDPVAAKGLEFDLVVIVDPDALDPVDRYVAMTRATRELALLS